MQLKGCLLIAFVLNVACLNNLSGKFLNRKYDSLKADQISLRKNESLVESLKKDPSSFVELFAKADPGTINEVIGILEGLIADAGASLNTLLTHQTDADTALDAANQNLVTADSNEVAARAALAQANTDKASADSAQVVAQGEQETAQLQKETADQNYAEQSPGSIKERYVLQEVIDTLRSLIDGWVKHDVNCHQGYDGVVHIGGEESGSLDDAKQACDLLDNCNALVFNRGRGAYQLRQIEASVDIDAVCSFHSDWVTYVK